jgi:hypothetical protein
MFMLLLLLIVVRRRYRRLLREATSKSLTDCLPWMPTLMMLVILLTVGQHCRQLRKGGHLEIVERLLAADADVYAAAAYDDGRTALQAAAGGGHLEVVDRLLAVKADVNAAPARYGRTAL